MLFLEVIVAVAVLFAIGAAVAVRRRELSPAVRDATDTRIPPQSMAMSPNDVDALRFGLAFRGYRMDQVDDALDRLREELRDRDERLAALAAATASGRPRTRGWTPPADDEADAEVAGDRADESAVASSDDPLVVSEPPEAAPTEPSAEPATEPAAAELPSGPVAEPAQPPAQPPAPPAAAPPAVAGGDRISKLRRPRPVPES